MSNFLMAKYKGIYTLKVEFDKQKNEFNKKLNGTYEDIDVYIQCKNQCRIFSYGHGTLQFYCPSIQRGKSIIKSIYGTYINSNNVNKIEKEVTMNVKNVNRTGKHIRYDIINEDVFLKDLESNDKIIFNIEITDGEVLFMFKNKNMSELEPFLKPSSFGCNRSPFSRKNLIKSDYKIPDEDLAAYKKAIANLPQNRFVELVHIAKKFLKEICKSDKEYDSKNSEMKRLGMKPKEYYHSIGKWNEYVNYVAKEIANV